MGAQRPEGQQAGAVGVGIEDAQDPVLRGLAARAPPERLPAAAARSGPRPARRGRGPPRRAFHSRRAGRRRSGPPRRRDPRARRRWGAGQRQREETEMSSRHPTCLSLRTRMPGRPRRPARFVSCVGRGRPTCDRPSPFASSGEVARTISPTDAEGKRLVAQNGREVRARSPQSRPSRAGGSGAGRGAGRFASSDSAMRRR